MTVASNKIHGSSEPKAVFRQNGQLSHSLSSNGSEVVVLVNAEGTVTYVSPSIITLLGYTLEEIVGCHIRFLIHPDDFDATQWGSGKTEADSSLYDEYREYRLRCKDGSWRSFE